MSILRRLFTSEARVRILNLFMTSPDDLHVREVARRTRLNLNSVRRELENLETAGLLTSTRKGNLKLYAADHKSPIHEELKRIILKTTGLGDTLKTQLAKTGTVETAFIYGSYARGDETLGSDIDLLIIGNIDQTKATPIFEKLEKQLSREINYTILTPHEFRERKAKHDPFITEILRQKRIPLVGS
jgi:predicted nucleotidyltransferase